MPPCLLLHVSGTERLSDTRGPLWDFPIAQKVKDLLVMQKNRFNHWVRKIPGEGNGNPLQYSCLENRTDRGAWWATISGITNSWTPLSD